MAARSDGRNITGDGGYRGMMTREPIAAGEVIVDLPGSLGFGTDKIESVRAILEVLWGPSGACIFVHFFALFAHWWGIIGPPGFAGFRRTSPAFGWCRFPGCLGGVA